MRTAKKKILVAGGAGFIGSNFLRYLSKKYKNYKLINYDLLTYAGNLKNVSDIEDRINYQFIKGDIGDTAKVSWLFKSIKPDIVVNFAAESHVDRSIADSRYFFRTNLVGVHNLVELCMIYKIPRFVQISTDEVYGDVPKGESVEASRFSPSNPYAASKSAADLLVQSYIRTYKIPALIIRGSNNYGEYQYPEKLIPLSITNILEDKKILVHGKGTQKRRWLYVEDFCEAIDIIMHKAKDFEIYNVSGEEMTNLEVLKKITSATNTDFLKIIKFIKDRPGGDSRYAASSTKIERDFGWKPNYSFSKKIIEVIKWYEVNQHWWSDIKRRDEFKIRYRKQYKSQY